MRPDVLLRSIAEHIGSYLELGSLAAAEYRDLWLRRLVLAVVAVLTGIAGLVIAWIAGLMAVWDSSWRWAYIVGSAVLLLGTAAWALRKLLVGTFDGPSVRVLKSELRQDKELFEQWKQKQKQ